MLMGGLLVHFGQGPVQIEMHFYFFALLAMLCMFANPAVNIAAAITVALHHLVVWLLVPGSVFNYDAQWWVVLVHATFVVIETIATCFISREFFDNVIGLEKIVDARTQTLNEKQRDMRLLLDTIEEGLITIDLYGRMSSECSHAVQNWFGAPVAGEKLSTWLGARDASYGEWLELSLETVRDAMLPVEVTLSQLPKQFVDGDRTYAVHYKVTSANDAANDAAPDAAPIAAPEQLLVVITDVTDRLRTESAERHQSELVRLFQHIMRDKAGFVEFLTEADEIVHLLEQRRYDSLDHMKRLIHTLKGNAAIFGMLGLSEICHELESWIADEATEPTASGMAELYETWTRMRAEVQQMIGEHATGLIEIDDAEYEAILQAVLDGVDARLVARMLESWRLEPTGKRLSRIEAQIKGLAERMGKSHVTVAISPNDLRFDSARFAPFWSAFIHVLRNTVDHGIEDLEAREASGKPAESTIRVSTRVDRDRFIVTVEDDGPGVDWDALRATARRARSRDRPASAIHRHHLPARRQLEDQRHRAVGTRRRHGGGAGCVRGGRRLRRSRLPQGSRHAHQLRVPERRHGLRRPHRGSAAGRHSCDVCSVTPALTLPPPTRTHRVERHDENDPRRRRLGHGTPAGVVGTEAGGFHHRPGDRRPRRAGGHRERSQHRHGDLRREHAEHERPRDGRAGEEQAGVRGSSHSHVDHRSAALVSQARQGSRRRRLDGQAVRRQPARPDREAPHEIMMSCDAGVVHPRTMEEIARAKKHVTVRAEELRALTEREVLACGDALSSLVDKARELMADSDRHVAASMARSEETMSRFASGMQEDILAQEAAVGRVLQLAEGIQNAVLAIEKLTESSNILAINCAIEAARVGEQARGFSVIADYMRELGNDIRTAAADVTSSIKGVRAGLPPVMQRATSMHARTREFVGEIGHHVRSASERSESGAMGGRLDEVLTLSNVALSHLQFQDPFVQGLTAMVGDVNQLEQRAARVLDGGGVTDAPEPENTALPSGARGRLVLF